MPVAFPPPPGPGASFIAVEAPASSPLPAILTRLLAKEEAMGVRVFPFTSRADLVNLVRHNSGGPHHLGRLEIVAHGSAYSCGPLYVGDERQFAREIQDFVNTDTEIILSGCLTGVNPPGRHSIAQAMANLGVFNVKGAQGFVNEGVLVEWEATHTPSLVCQSHIDVNGVRISAFGASNGNGANVFKNVHPQPFHSKAVLVKGFSPVSIEDLPESTKVRNDIVMSLAGPAEQMPSLRLSPVLRISIDLLHDQWHTYALINDGKQILDEASNQVRNINLNNVPNLRKLWTPVSSPVIN